MTYEGAKMQRTKAKPPAERMAKHRRGVKAELIEIRSTLEDLRRDVREVLAAKMVRKSVVTSEERNAD
jgi:hypothetical protein